MFGTSFRTSFMGYPKTHLRTFVSLPHFLDADPSFRDQFTKESMKPDRARCERTKIVPWKCDMFKCIGCRHSSSMTLQMETSIPIQVSAEESFTSFYDELDSQRLILKRFLPGSDATSDNPPTAAESQNRVVLRKDPRSIPASSLV